MKIKIIGFKVGQSRPTANRTLDLADKDVPSVREKEARKPGYILSRDDVHLIVGEAVYQTLLKSDFISIRRVDD